MLSFKKFFEILRNKSDNISKILESSQIAFPPAIHLNLQSDNKVKDYIYSPFQQYAFQTKNTSKSLFNLEMKTANTERQALQCCLNSLESSVVVIQLYGW